MIWEDTRISDMSSRSVELALLSSINSSSLLGKLVVSYVSICYFRCETQAGSHPFCLNKPHVNCEVTYLHKIFQAEDICFFQVLLCSWYFIRKLFSSNPLMSLILEPCGQFVCIWNSFGHQCSLRQDIHKLQELPYELPHFNTVNCIIRVRIS